MAVDLGHASQADAAATTAKLEAGLKAAPDVAFVAPAQLNPAGNAAVVIVIPKTSPQSSGHRRRWSTTCATTSSPAPPTAPA